MEHKINTTSENKIDWKLVKRFKKSLKDLKEGNIEEFQKGSLTD